MSERHYNYGDFGRRFDIYGRAAKEGKDVQLGPIQICEVCGYTVEGEAPEICSVCKAKKDRFKAY